MRAYLQASHRAGFFAVPPWRVSSDHSLWVLAKGRPWCNKYIPVVGTVCSINTHIFPYVKRFILTTVEEVRHILEPGKWSTEKRREVTCSVVCLSKTKMFWNRSPKFPNYILKYYDGWITMLDLAGWWLGSSYGQLLTLRALPIQFNSSKTRRTFPLKHNESIHVNSHVCKKNKITILFWMG